MRYVLVLCLFGPLVHAQTSEGVDYFEKNVRPLLAANCYPCHSAKSNPPMRGLLLDSRAGTQRVIVPGKPEESLLITAVRGTGSLKMPPGKPLDAAQVETLVTWVKLGAPDPRADLVPAAPLKPHWSFQPIRDPQPPHSAAGNAIDAFLQSARAAHHLNEPKPASKLTLIRRATYDLTGLPPTPEEIDAFVKDSGPNAFAKVVDRLLASRAYGEKWGRHWLDVVRYADTAGDNADFPVPAMALYRNWVIDAFNRDIPYDRFLKLQLAGDLMPDPEVIPTSYISNSRRFGSRANEFHLTIDDTIDNLGKSMLGLTIACARCHDHKFDPIPTADYYALYGIFKSTAYPHPGTEIYPHTYGFAALNAADAARLKGFEDQLSGLDNRIEDMKAGKIKFASDAEKRKAEQDNQANLRRLSREYPAIAKAYAVHDGKGANARIMVRGEPATLGAEAPRGFLQILGGQKLPASESGSGRRELADWIACKENPLTARVIVNRVWQWHFGQGIVATPDDFGARGEPPSHPELLDHLASRFIEDGWSLKKLHRRIMLTRAYQSATTYSEAEALKDAKDAYLWRFPPRRLEAEEVRDSILFLSGNLDPTPAAEQPFPPEMSWKYTQHTPFIGADKDYATRKRSIYLMQQRIRRQRFLELFDGADPNSETGVRALTTTALQALFTMNDTFVHEQADALAVRVGMSYGPDAERINAAYRLIYGRTATADEIKGDRAYLAKAREALGSAAMPDFQRTREAWASLMRVLLSSNEFLILE